MICNSICKIGDRKNCEPQDSYRFKMTKIYIGAFTLWCRSRTNWVVKLNFTFHKNSRPSEKKEKKDQKEKTYEIRKWLF